MNELKFFTLLFIPLHSFLQSPPPCLFSMGHVGDNISLNFIGCWLTGSRTPSRHMELIRHGENVMSSITVSSHCGGQCSVILALSPSMTVVFTAMINNF